MRSELGVLGYLLIYIRETIHATRRKPDSVLSLLSQRFTDAATELGLRKVPCLFDDKHGRISSLHYRTLAEVVEVITCDIFDEEEPIAQVIHTTVAWYWACRSQSFTSADLDSLQGKTDAMLAAWAVLDTPLFRTTLRASRETPKRCVLEVPKFHRLKHVVDYIRRWGPMEFLTTETSESLHKPFKSIFRACVNALLCMHAEP